MLDTLKSLWAKWKVQVSFVGGALVVATTFGTCSYDPQTVSEVQVEEPTEEVSETTSETTAVPVSGTDNTTATETETTVTE
jgi:hypothetical protein